MVPILQVNFGRLDALFNIGLSGGRNDQNARFKGLNI
jgi:hypothetical protein